MSRFISTGKQHAMPRVSVALNPSGQGPISMKLKLAIMALLWLAGAPGWGHALDWPQGRKAAIVLTYDDAMMSHLDNAVPALEARGLKATFFLNVRFDEKGVERWRAVAALGHELANHTIFHPCRKGTFAMEPQYESERYSAAGMVAEIGAMNVLLHAVDGKTGRTFGVPCAQRTAGGEDYGEALRRSGLIRYVRNGITDDAIIRDPLKLDSMDVPSRAFEESATAADIIAWVKEVEKSGGMGVIVFHGVGGDWLPVTLQAHGGLLDYLAGHRDTIWTAPFQEVMDYVAKTKAS